MTGKIRRKDWQVDGASRITLTCEGKVSEHVDFWDAAQGLYEMIPLIGPLLRMLRRRIGLE